MVEAPFQVADVLASNGHKWARAGTSTGFLALSDRAVDELTPVFSGFAATDHEGTPVDEVLPPTRGVRAFTVSNPDLIAAGRFAAALEELAAVGVGAVQAEVTDRVSRLIELADEFSIPVASVRLETERAGIVVLATARGAADAAHRIAAQSRRDRANDARRGAVEPPCHDRRRDVRHGSRSVHQFRQRRLIRSECRGCGGPQSA